MQLPGALLSPILKKKKNSIWKNLLYFLKKKKLFLYFDKITLIFWEMELLSPTSTNKKDPRKKFLYFLIWNFVALYFSYISWSNFPGSKNI